MEVCCRMDRTPSSYALRTANGIGGQSSSSLVAAAMPQTQQPPPSLMAAPLIAAANALTSVPPPVNQQRGGIPANVAGAAQMQAGPAAALGLPADFSNLFHHYQSALAAGQLPANQAAALAAAAPYVCQPLATAMLPYGLFPICKQYFSYF